MTILGFLRNIFSTNDGEKLPLSENAEAQLHIENANPIIKEKYESVAAVTTAQVKTTLPVGGGTSSYPENNLYRLIRAQLAVSPDVTPGVLLLMEQLSFYKDDFSLAVTNIALMAGADIDVALPASIKSANAGRMMEEIDTLKKNIYNGGINSLTTDLLAQIAINGALSAEAIVSPKLDSVTGVSIVSPKYIQFVYDQTKYDWHPYQLNTIAGNDVTVNGTRLNTYTYKYIPLIRLNEKPYGVPPLLAALEGVQLEHEMMCEVKKIIRKMGLLGFLEVLVNEPNQDIGESHDEYWARCATYINTQVRPEVEKGLNNGFVIGFKESHEFKLQDTVSNITGFDTVLNIVNHKKRSGLKQNPMLFGDNQTTTESLAKVLIVIMKNQITTYQRILCSFYEDVFLLHLKLKGFDVKGLTVAMRPPVIEDEGKEEIAKGKKIENVLKKRDAGIISQLQAAQELGYDKPALAIAPPIQQQTKTPISGQPAQSSNALNYEAIRKFIAGPVEFAYEIPKECGCGSHHDKIDTQGFKNEGAKAGKAIVSYEAEAQSLYSEAITEVMGKIGKRIESMAAETTTLEEFTNAIMGTIYLNWEGAFTTKIKTYIDKSLASIYGYLRKDITPFAGASNIPAATFGLLDQRAITFWENFDKFYLGKFITDEDTRDRFTKWIQDKYLGQNLPIGSNKTAIAEFRKQFPELMQLENWKITRIINTSSTKMRNVAAVAYMNQAEIVNYEILGITDSLQCAWCKELQGKKIPIKGTVELINKVLDSTPEQVPALTPFVNSTYSAAEIKNLTGEQMLGAGISTPPFHPNCRDTIVVSD